MSEKEETHLRATEKHQQDVSYILDDICMQLIQRGRAHDESKKTGVELATFAEYGPKLKEVEYGSQAYTENLHAMGPVLIEHYRKNRHHPEHYKNGVTGMTLIDVLEMVADWIAVARGIGGDIMESITINAHRFNLDLQVEAIIRNTLIAMEPKTQESNRRNIA